MNKTPHFLMGFNHLSSLQIKTIIVQLPMIDICFRDFKSHTKNGECRVKWKRGLIVKIPKKRKPERVEELAGGDSSAGFSEISIGKICDR